MESVAVTTVAGSNRRGCKDGIGTGAAVFDAEAICYSKATGTLLFVDTDSHCVRRVDPAPTADRKSELKSTLVSTLIESNALPVQVLISIILKFAVGNSTSDSNPTSCHSPHCN